MRCEEIHRDLQQFGVQISRDVDPHLLFANPDPRNLMKADPVQVQVNKITELI